MPVTSDSRNFERLVSEAPGNHLKILAEGDSWFAYPRRFLVAGPAANVVQVLAKKKRYVIYETARNGDEAVSMLSGAQKFSLTKRLKHTAFDLLLFSGGGNDLVGKYDFDFLIRRRGYSADASKCIHYRRLDNKVSQIRSAYVELLERVREYAVNPNAKVVTHTYDFAIPDPTGFELFDEIPVTEESWMYPFLKNKGFDDDTERRLIVRIMLTRFQDMLLALERQYEGLFFVARTQELLSERDWLNEIHPKPKGFRVIARAIEERMLEALSHEAN